jgi:hypothetical protein
MNSTMLVPWISGFGALVFSVYAGVRTYQDTNVSLAAVQTRTVAGVPADSDVDSYDGGSVLVTLRMNLASMGGVEPGQTVDVIGGVDSDSTVDGGVLLARAEVYSMSTCGLMAPIVDESGMETVMPDPSFEVQIIVPGRAIERVAAAVSAGDLRLVAPDAGDRKANLSRVASFTGVADSPAQDAAGAFDRSSEHVVYVTVGNRKTVVRFPAGSLFSSDVVPPGSKLVSGH